MCVGSSVCPVYFFLKSFYGPSFYAPLQFTNHCAPAEIVFSVQLVLKLRIGCRSLNVVLNLKHIGSISAFYCQGYHCACMSHFQE